MEVSKHEHGTRGPGITPGRRKHGNRVDAFRLAAVTLVLALLAGCAYEQAYKRGDKLAREGRYEQAVAELEAAVRLAEENHQDKTAVRYRAKLAQVKQQAGHFLYREAQLRFNRADLGAAQSYIERSLAFCPQEPTYESFRQRVLQAIGEAERVRADALALAEQRQWQSAVARMEEALALYRTMPGGDGDLQRIRDRAYQYCLDRANERLRADDLAEAQAQAETALFYRQAGSEAKAVIQAVKDRREAAVLLARGRTLLDRGDAEEALAALERAARLHPTHPDLTELLGRAKRMVCDRRLEQGRAALTASDYPGAIRLFQKSQGLLATYGGVDALLADARARLAALHLEASRQFQQDGAAGCATFHAAAALNYLPESLEARQQLGQCVEQVRQDVAYTVAFAGFQSTPQQRVLAALLEAAALEHLTRSHPPNVMVVERADLRGLLDEPAGRSAAASGVQTGTPSGVDALISGQILESRVASESKQTGHGESVYQDGYRAEPNPEHVQAAASFDTAVERLETARRRLAEAEVRLARYKNTDPAHAEEWARKRKAQADVDEARQRLASAAAEVTKAKLRVAAIPPKVLVPNMVKHRYPIETFTWTAKVACMLKMRDTATGEVLLAERVEGQAAHSDRMVAADAARNVPEDPLVLPSETALLERAADAALVKVRQILSQACEEHGQRFLAQMQRAEGAGDPARAADGCIKYLFAYPGGRGDTGAMVEFLRQYLADENDLVDVRRLLQTHCHLLQTR
jgi:tetratricopeptide (TPR) repeat protein